MSLLFSRSSSRPPLRTAAVNLWTSTLQGLRHRQAEHTLQGMSDAMLHGIGVDRGEIVEMTRHGRYSRH